MCCFSPLPAVKCRCHVAGSVPPKGTTKGFKVCLENSRKCWILSNQENQPPPMEPGSVPLPWGGFLGVVLLFIWGSSAEQTFHTRVK